MVDYNVGDLVETVSSRSSADVLHDKWLGVYGPMMTLITDQGPEFSKDMASLCEFVGVMLEFPTADTKWKAGRAERHGALAKIMIMPDGALAWPHAWLDFERVNLRTVRVNGIVSMGELTVNELCPASTPGGAG